MTPRGKVRSAHLETWIPTICLLLLSVSILGLAVGPGEKKREAIITYVRGDVEKKVQKQPDWLEAELRSQVITGDSVRTLVQSRSEVQLADRTMVRLDEKSLIEIRHLVRNDKGVGADIMVEEGDVWSSVGDSTLERFTVASQVAGASVRGTIFRLSVAEDRSTEIKVYRGKVEIYNPLAYEKMKAGDIFEGPREVAGPGESLPSFREVSREEWVYHLGKMQKIQIGPQGQLVEKGEFMKDDDDEMSEWVRWNQERDKLLMGEGKKEIEVKEKEVEELDLSKD